MCAMLVGEMDRRAAVPLDLIIALKGDAHTFNSRHLEKGRGHTLTRSRRHARLHQHKSEKGHRGLKKNEHTHRHTHNERWIMPIAAIQQSPGIPGYFVPSASVVF